MPAIAAWIIGALASCMGSLIGRALLALGVQFVAFKGVDVLLRNLMTSAMLNFTGLPSGVVGMMGELRVDEALSILAGAVAARFVISGLSSGVVTRLVHK